MSNKPDYLHALDALIQLFRETAAEGKMMIVDQQFRAYLQHYPDHYVSHIRLEYVCSLNANSCAMLTERLVEKIILAGYDKLPIMCCFTNIKRVPGQELEDAIHAPQDSVSILDYAKQTGMNTDQVLTLVKPEFIRIVLPK